MNDNKLHLSYGKEDVSTDFTFYSDDNVKVFAKELQPSDGTDSSGHRGTSLQGV